MILRTIVSVMGQVFGWYPETKEFISTVHKDGRCEVVRSRVSAKVWNYYLAGINVKLFQELKHIKESESSSGNVEAVMMFRGGRIQRLKLCWDKDESTYTVGSEEESGITYGDLDRAMLMFSLRLETLMKERMETLGC